MRRAAPFRTLDVFRGLGALWVVMGHSCVPFVSAHPVYKNWVYDISAKGVLGVVLFFVISGYCIMAAVYGALLRQKSVGRYLFDRVRRIYPPYLFTFALTVLISYSLMVAVRHHWMSPGHLSVALDRSPSYWIGNLFLLQFELHVPFTNVVFWSLCYEVSFYVIMAVLLLLAKAVWARAGVYGGTLVLVLGTCLVSIVSLTWLIVEQTEVFPLALWHLFALGCLLFFCFEDNVDLAPAAMPAFRRIAWGSFGIVALLVGVFAIFRQIGEDSYDHPSSRVLSATALLFCGLLIAIYPQDAWLSERAILRPLLWLGTFSYSLYLIHPVVLPIVDVSLRMAGLNDGLYPVTFVVEILTGIFAGRVMFLAVERHFISKRQKERVHEETGEPAVAAG